MFTFQESRDWKFSDLFKKNFSRNLKNIFDKNKLYTDFIVMKKIYQNLNLKHIKGLERLLQSL